MMRNTMCVRNLFILIILLLTTTLSHGQRRWFVSENWNKTVPLEPLSLPYSSDIIVQHEAGFVTEDGNGVSSWTDLSGNGNHSVQSNNSKKPTTDDNGAIVYDGTTEYLELGGYILNPLTETTIFLIASKTRNTADNREYFIEYNDRTNDDWIAHFIDSVDLNTYRVTFTGSNAGSGSKTDTFNYDQTYSFVTAYEENGTNEIYINDVIFNSYASNTFSDIGYGGGAVLGGYSTGGGDYFKGTMYAFVVYDRKLNMSEIHEVNAVLNQRYTVYTDPQLQLSYSEDLVLYHLAGYGVTSDANGVSQWDDLSGNGNHATQGTTTNKPTLNNADGSLGFITNDYLSWNSPATFLNSYDSITVFSVQKLSSSTDRFECFYVYNDATAGKGFQLLSDTLTGSPSTYKYQLQANIGGSTYRIIDTVNYDEYHLTTHILSENDEIVNRLNGVEKNQITRSGSWGNINPGTGSRIGANYNVTADFIDGDIELLAIYGRKLTNFEIVKVELEIADYLNIPIDTISISSFIDNELIAGWSLDTFNSTMDGTTVDQINCILGTNAEDSDWNLVPYTGSSRTATIRENGEYSLHLSSASMYLNANVSGLDDVTYVLFWENSGGGSLIGEQTNGANITSFRNDDTNKNLEIYAQGTLVVLDENAMQNDVYIGALGFDTNTDDYAWNIKKVNNGLLSNEFSITDRSSGVYSAGTMPTMDRLVFNASNLGTDLGDHIYNRYILAFDGDLTDDEVNLLVELIIEGVILID